MSKTKLRWPDSCTPGACSVLVWLGGCRKRWDDGENQDLGGKWPADTRHNLIPPQPLGFFTSDLFDLFRESERGALVELVRLYLPEREAECTALTLKPCTSDDAAMLQEMQNIGVVVVPRLQATHGLNGNDAAQLLGGFACALPIYPTQLPGFSEVDYTEVREFGSWELTITATLSPVAVDGNGDPVHTREVADADCKRFGRYKDGVFLDSTRHLTFIVQAKLRGKASYDSEVPTLGVCCERVWCSKDKLASRNALFGSQRQPLTGTDATEWVVSEALLPSEYEEALNQHSLCTMISRKAPTAVVPLERMDAPAYVGQDHIFSPSRGELQKIATAWDSSDVLGDESCAAFELYRFEVHTLKPTASPYLESYSASTYGDLGAKWSECAFLEIAGC